MHICSSNLYVGLPETLATKLEAHNYKGCLCDVTLQFTITGSKWLRPVPPWQYSNDNSNVQSEFHEDMVWRSWSGRIRVHRTLTSTEDLWMDWNANCTPNLLVRHQGLSLILSWLNGQIHTPKSSGKRSWKSGGYYKANMGMFRKHIWVCWSAVHKLLAM